MDLKLILKINLEATKLNVMEIKTKGGYVMQKLKGLWIPADILLNKDLSDKEKIILAMILYLSEEKGSCFASNKYIANIVNVTHERVSKIISSLKDM